MSGTRTPPGPPAAPPVVPEPARALSDVPAPGDPAPFTELSARRLGPVRRYLVRHPVAMDVVVVVCFLLVAGLGATAEAAPMPSERELAMLALTAVTAAALFWRRRRPLLVMTGLVALFAAGLALTEGATPVDLALAFGMYAVTTARPAWVAWATFVATVAAATTAIYLMPSFVEPVGGRVKTFAEPDRVGGVIVVVVLLLVGLAIGTSVRGRRLHVADLVARANALARDRDQQAALARASERSRIAREMHDVVAHSLSVMIALADGAGVAMERSPDRARAALTELSSTGRAALADMRRVLGVLDGPQDDAAPLEPQATDLDELVERFRTAGLPVRAVLDGPLPDDANLRVAVHRVVQEALTNTLRHAPGTPRVDVRVTPRPGAVEVEVRDGGARLPVAPSPGAGRGLIGMRERAAVYGGTVDAGPSAGGWRVHATFPWHQEG